MYVFHSQVSRRAVFKERREISSDVFRYIEHALIIWDKIKTLQVLQQAKKAPDAWSQHETTQKTNKKN